YVHRYDLQNRTWTIAQAPKIAWKIEAVSPDRVLLQEHDQHVDMTLNSFGYSMTELARIRADYYGDFEYDPYTQRVYHGCSGSSSREIHVRRVSGDTLVDEGNTGTYGTAQGGGGTSVLSTDGYYFYYGKLQVEAMNVKNNLHMMTQTIYAASDKIAFGESRYYDAETGAELSGLGFSTTVYGVSEDGKHLWAYESEDNMLHYYRIQSAEDNHPPIACIEGENRFVEAQDANGAVVNLDGSCSADEDSTDGTNDDIVQFNWYEKITDGNNISLNLLAIGEEVDVLLSLGEHIIVLEVIDSQDASDQTEVAIIVGDTVPPKFELSVSPSVLWPPNHKLIEVTPTWTVNDNCDDAPTVSLVTITVQEETRKKVLKNNEHTEDVFIDADGKIYLRAERSGNSNGRVYTLTYQAVDDSANTTIKSTTVTVPHNQSKDDAQCDSENDSIEVDFNMNNCKSFKDLTGFVNNWLSDCSSPDWCSGHDYNQSTRVDFIDFAKFAADWLNCSPS
ncbi:MAG: hypothetical protein JW806_03460, partial [Sedimentisphaerales bacterium]|nr:hypothetical protein [Sedimentisphaerales bacterium]